MGRFLLFMTLNTILGQKKEQSQKFLENGTRIPVTRIWVKGNVITNVRTQDKNHYSAIQLGFGSKKNATKSILGNTKGARQNYAPNFLKEVRMNADTDLAIGTMINASEILAEGDIINVTGVSKGKGYAGVVKRYGFHGGPKTHGQSDRHRAPGSIGQGTTPGRVYRGKRMAGRMGNENVTIRNLVVVGVTDDEVLVKGLIPGGINTMVIVKKVGENKKFVPLFKEPSSAEALEDKKTDEPAVEEKVQSSVSESADLSTSDDAQAVDLKTEDQTSPSLSGSQSPEPEDKTKKDLGLTSDSLETDSSVTKKDNKDVKEDVENAG